MQCNVCGTQLPVGAAYCPTCGSITPYQVSSSGVAPSDSTVASSYADTRVATSYGESPQHPYTFPDPYAASPPTPPPPPPRRRKLSVGKMLLVIVLVLLIVGAGGALYFRLAPSSGQPQPHASPTAQVQQATAIPSPTTQAQQATATPSAQTPQDLYAQITQSSPVLDDPLSTNDTNNWTETTSADGQSRCAFSGGAYHASAQAKNTYMLCVAQATNFGNLAYQVQMTIVKGEFGGIVFRTDSSQTKYYSFFIDISGTYTLITSVDNTGTNDRLLGKATSAFIRTGLNQVNLLTVVARGSSIYVYINQHYITSASDSTYSAGQIGVFGGNYTRAPADVVFSHVQVWQV
jgi:hypothetical protein